MIVWVLELLWQVLQIINTSVTLCSVSMEVQLLFPSGDLARMGESC